MKRRGSGDGTIYQPKGSRFWWISYYSGGKRHFESSKSEKKGDAKQLLDNRLKDIRGGVNVTPAMGKLTIGEGLRAVVADMTVNARDSVKCVRCGEACGKEEHSTAISRQMKHLVKRVWDDGKTTTGYFAPERLMANISTSDLTAYVANRVAQKAAGSSINHELALVRRAFKLAIRARTLATMPHIPMVKLDNRRTGFFERAEFDAVLEQLPKHLHAPLTFAYVTGWRLKSEVLPLTADRVDVVAGVVRLDPGTTKSGEGRTFYMTAELKKLLTTQLDSLEVLKQAGTISPYVFHYEGGERIRDFKKQWKTATENAGYPGKLFHDFRRTAVRNLERAAVPRSVAMSMVGHKTEHLPPVRDC
jgi:integrase